jgi:hypothetical protein
LYFFACDFFGYIHIAQVSKPCSGLEHQKTPETPAGEAGEAIPAAAGELAGGQ